MTGAEAEGGGSWIRRQGEPGGTLGFGPRRIWT